jgi:hypothetical protein
MVVEDVNPQQHFLSVLECINAARKHLMRFAVDSNGWLPSAVSRMRGTEFSRQ